MIVDSSAIIAIVDAEPGFDELTVALGAAPSARISAATLVEVQAVILRRNTPDVLRRVAKLLDKFAVEVMSFDAEQSRIASDAYRDFGRGSGHSANLNLGDCFSYALASSLDEPLLFVGDDFTHTDLTPALAPPVPRSGLPGFR